MQPKNEEAGRAVAAAIPSLNSEADRRRLASNLNDKPKQVRLHCEACSRSFVKILDDENASVRTLAARPHSGPSKPKTVSR